ncbi:MAG: Ig-like domain-containing protein [Haloferula sp.]
MEGTQTSDLNDTNNDGKASPGEQIDHSIELTNKALLDALNVRVQDSPDANTTLVPGSAMVGPIGIDDSYGVTGNLAINVPASAGVLINDLDPDGGADPVLVVVETNITSVNGGSVAMQSDGAFLYTPPAGFAGTDSFEYSVRDSQNLVGLSKGVVTLNVSGGLWFVDMLDPQPDNLPTAGTASNPFNSIDAFMARNTGTPGNIKSGDIIYMMHSAMTYVGSITLLPSQKLLGSMIPPTQANLGVIAQYAVIPPVNGALPTPISSSSGSAITIATNNTVRGIHCLDTPLASFGLAGNNFGTLNLGEFSVSGSGGTLSLRNGNLATSSIGDLRSTESITGLILDAIQGSGFTLANPSVLDIAGFISTGVDIRNCTAPIAFDVANISTTETSATVGLFAAGNSSLMTNSGVINTGLAIAVDIDTSGLGINLTSVSVDGANHGIDLRSTTGTFVVNGGSGTVQDGSGGIIQNTVSDGIFLESAAGVTLRKLNMNGVGRSAVRGRQCSNFTYENAILGSFSGTPAPGLHALDFDSTDNSGQAAITGTLALNNVDISGFVDTGLFVHNESGSLTAQISNDCDFIDNDDTFGRFGIYAEANNSASINMTVSDADFDSIEGRIVHFEHDSTSLNSLTMTGNSSVNGGGSDDSGGGGVGCIAAESGTFNITIEGNTFTDHSSTCIELFGALNTTQLLNASIRNNVLRGNHTTPFFLGDGISLLKESGGDWNVNIISNDLGPAVGSASNYEYGIYLINRDNTGTLKARLDTNIVSGTDSDAIRVFTDNDLPAAVASTPSNQLTIDGNTISNSLGDACEIRVRDTALACVNATNNNFGIPNFVLDQSGTFATINVPQSSAAAISAANNSANTSFSGTINFNQAACSTPTLP